MNDRINKLNDEINKLDDQINRLNSKMDILNDRMDKLDDRTDIINDRIDNTDDKISALGKQGNQTDIMDNKTSSDNKTPLDSKTSLVNSILIETVEEAKDLLNDALQTVNEYHEMYISDQLNEEQKTQLRKLEIRVKELQDKLKNIR